MNKYKVKKPEENKLYKKIRDVEINKILTKNELPLVIKSRLLTNEYWASFKNSNVLVSNYGRYFKPSKGLVNYDKNINFYYNVYFNREINSITLHRLVALAFVPNDDPINKPIVNHIDHNKRNNKAENLEWVSIRENTLHSMNGEVNIFNYKIRIIDTKDNNKVYIADGSSEAARITNTNVELLLATDTNKRLLFDRWHIIFGANILDMLKSNAKKKANVYYYDFLTKEHHGPYTQRYTIYLSKIMASTFRVGILNSEDGYYYKAGYIFGYRPIPKTIINKYTHLNHKALREEYINRSFFVNSINDKNMIHVKHPYHNLDKSFKTTREVSLEIGIETSHLSKVLYSMKHGKRKYSISKGYIISYERIEYNEVNLSEWINSVLNKEKKSPIYYINETLELCIGLEGLNKIYDIKDMVPKSLRNYNFKMTTDEFNDFLNKRYNKDIRIDLMEDTLEDGLEFLEDILKINKISITL